MISPRGIIQKKRDRQTHTPQEIAALIRGYMSGEVADYHMSSWLMAVYLNGLEIGETLALTKEMRDSGKGLKLSSIPTKKIDKHSTGGVGDKVSIVLAPIAAACGVVVPKMSGRGLGHTGGTLDKLESIPGFRVSFSLLEFKSALKDIGCCLISQTASIVPADKALYALRDVTATIESLPLIASSVMSKKIAEGSDAVVLDVKCGRGAFMKSQDDAYELARALVSIGTHAGVRTEAFITRMDAPLGRAVGNALEIQECIDMLRGDGPEDLKTIVLRIAARMVQLGGHAGTEVEARAKVEAAIESGAALEKFRAVIERQDGDPRVIDEPSLLPSAAHVHTIPADRSGVVSALDAFLVGRASVALGAGRDRKGDPVDFAAGLRVVCKPGEQVTAGDPVLELHYNDPSKLPGAVALAAQAIEIGDDAPADEPLVIGWVYEGSEGL